MSLAVISKNLDKGFYKVVIDYDSAELEVYRHSLSAQYWALWEQFLANLDVIVKLSKEIEDLGQQVAKEIKKIVTAFEHVEAATCTILQGAPLSFLKVSQALDGERDRWANIQEKLNEVDTWAEKQLDIYLDVLVKLVEKSNEREKLRQKNDYLENEMRLLSNKLSLLFEITATKKRTVNCIDYTVNLLDATDAGLGGQADTVGIIDIIGETEQQFIYPGSLINSDYQFGLSSSNNHQLALWDGQRDGNMRKTLAFMFPAAVWLDAALFPGWQRWFPYYRTAKIVGLVHLTQYFDVEGELLEAIYDLTDSIPEDVVYPTKIAYYVVEVLSNSSSIHSKDISLPETKKEVLIEDRVVEGKYYQVPVEYMQTGAMNFSINDIVILDFVRRPPQIFIIGFALAPLPNFFPVIIEYQKFRNGQNLGWFELTDEDVVEGNPIPLKFQC